MDGATPPSGAEESLIEIARERGPKSPRDVVYGIYRDGDNNLDRVQSATIDSAQRASAEDSHITFAVENTTHDGVRSGGLHTEDGTIAEGRAQWSARPAADMASPKELARFVERTLETAHARGGQQAVWIELVDHGGGDGGGLEADSAHAMMAMPGMAKAIAEGTAAYNAAHPDDARHVEGVVANQCLMSTLGFAEELSRAGVQYLAASPETMIAPGVPSGDVAQAVQRSGGDPGALGKGVVDAVMDRRYHLDGEGYRPAAAFNVLDLAPEKIAAMEQAVQTLNNDIATLPHDDSGDRAAEAVAQDGARTRGMVRFEGDPTLPWNADRPAEALYGRLAGDGRLPEHLRRDAAAAAQAVDGLVIADREAARFEPGSISYRDAAGPTVHFPVNAKQYDAWAKNGVSETDNRFFHDVDGRDAARRLGAVA